MATPTCLRSLRAIRLGLSSSLTLDHKTGYENSRVSLFYLPMPAPRKGTKRTPPRFLVSSLSPCLVICHSVW